MLVRMRSAMYTRVTTASRTTGTKTAATKAMNSLR
jgi:hypothetical protein